MSTTPPPTPPGGIPAGGGVRLTAEEQQLVAKLLSDPTYFPVEFRTWLKNYIEQSGITITASQVTGIRGGTLTSLPAGIILAIAATAAVPADTLPCDGTTRVRTDYPALFNAIGATWGAGDGSTTFNLPDLRDRALYGVGGHISLAVTDGVAYGSRGGADHYHNINQTSGGGGAHSHAISGSTSSVGDHSHTPPADLFAEASGVTAALGTGGSARYLVTNYAGSTNAAGGHSHSISGNTDTSSTHTHVLAGPTSGGYAADHGSFAGVMFVITTGG